MNEREEKKESCQKNIVCISYGFQIEPKVIEIGQCVTARYYKGFSNFNPENAVIVKMNNE